LPLTEMRRFSAKIEGDVYDYLSAEAVVARRRSLGGTAQSNVRRRLKQLRV
jgi:argininosuccinate lyase